MESTKLILHFISRRNSPWDVRRWRWFIFLHFQFKLLDNNMIIMAVSLFTTQDDPFLIFFLNTYTLIPQSNYT